MIELYAITDAPGPPLPELAPLSVLPSGELAVVYGPAGEDDVTADALWRHEATVEALMERHDVLPFRYGTRCEDEAAAARAVQARRRELTAALARIRGAVELSVRGIAVQGPNGSSAAGDTGLDYLEAKARESAEAQAAIERVHRPLSAMARASHRRASSEAEVLRMAYLVDRDKVGEFAREVARVQNDHRELRLLCTGPWPPYSFTEP